MIIKKSFVNRLDVLKYTETPLYRDCASVYEVIVKKRKELMFKNVHISLYGDRVVIGEGTENELSLPFSELSAVTVLGRNKLNIYHDKRVYQLKGGKRFNALKYVNIYFRHKNITKGDGHGEFLGL